MPHQGIAGRRLVVLFGCFLSQMIVLGIGYAMSVMFVELVAVFEADRTQAALVQGLYMGVATAAGILFIGLIKHMGPGPSMAMGSFISAVGFIGCYFVKNIGPIIVLAGLVSGMGASICYLTSFMATNWIFHENAGVPLIFLSVGSSVGQFAMPLVYQWLIDAFAWNGTYLILAGFLLQGIPIGVFIYFSKSLYKNRNNEPDGKCFEILSICDVSLLRDILIWNVIVSCFLATLTGNIEPFFIVDIMVSRGFSITAGSTVASVIGLANLCGRLIGVLLKHMFKRTPTIYHWIYLSTIVAVCHVIIISVTDYWSTVVTGTVYGVAYGVLSSQMPAVMLEVAGVSRYPHGIGMLNVMLGLGDFIGSVLGGFIRDTFGQYSVMFYIASAASIYVSLASIHAAYVLRKRIHGDAETFPILWKGSS